MKTVLVAFESIYTSSQREFLFLSVEPVRPVHTAPETFEKATISGHFRFLFEENSGRENTKLSWHRRF